MMQNPGMPVQHGSPADVLFNSGESAVEFTQESHCPKCCMIGFCAVGADKFNVKTAQIFTVSEESDWCTRNPMQACFPCLQKKATYNLDMGSQNALKYVQEGGCVCINSWLGSVYGENQAIGKVGLQRTCCGLGNGCRNCAFDCASWGGCCSCTSAGYAICSYEWCLCAGFHILPTRIYDSNGTHTHNVSATCCQIGVLCSQFCCDACRTIDFDVTDLQGNQITQIQRLFPCTCCTVYNRYTVKFPPQATRQAKELMFAAALSLHTLYFDV